MANRTVLQRTNVIGFPKAGELIEITGAHELEAFVAVTMNIGPLVLTNIGPPPVSDLLSRT